MSTHHTERFKRFLLHQTLLNPAELTGLITHFQMVGLKKNDYFLKAGMPVHKVGFLDNGILRRFIIDKKGNEITRQFISEEHFFTDLDGFYEQKPSGTYIQAITHSRLFILSISELENLQEEMPRLRPIVSQISQQHLLERIKLEDMLRIGTASDQYNYLIDHSPHLMQQVPLKYVASYLRITPQSLSRIRRERR